LGISWEDKRTNVSVLDEGHTTSIEAIIIKNQLRWSGHVVRMGDERLPKQIFYSELKEGKRKRGGQKKRFKDALKASMKKCNIDSNTWETKAKDKETWRETVTEGTAAFEESRCSELEDKRRRRKEKLHQHKPDLPHNNICPECGRIFKAKIGLISHLRTHKQTR